MRSTLLVAALVILVCTCAWSYTNLDDPADPWLTSRTGITQQVPHPFESLSVDGSTVSCWGREYSLAAPLPAQVISQNETLLARPMRVVATIGGEEMVLSGAPVELTTTRGDRVEFAGSCPAGAATVESAGWLEYDGAMQVNLTVRGQVSLERLAIEIPCRPEVTPFFYVGHHWGQDFYELVGTEPGWSWEYGWQGTVWLGDHYRGLSFFTESYRDWSGPNEGRLRIERTDDAVVFRATVVSEPVQVDGTRTWTLGLQATPGKPLPDTSHGRHVGQGSATETPEGARERYEAGQRVALIWSTATKWFSFPEGRNPDGLTQAVRNYHEAGLKVVVYINLSSLAMPAQVLRRHWDEWMLSKQGKPLYASQPSERSEGYSSVCAASGYTDWLVWAVDRAMEDYDLDGVYMDNTGPYSCDNELHGCGPGTRWPFFATRELHKRLWTVIHGRKPEDGIIWEHNSETSTSVNLTFADVYSDGEHFRVKSKGHPEEITRTFLDITASGRQWGAQPAFLPSALNTREEYTDWMLARLLPFGNVMFLIPSWMDFSRLSPVLRARVDFGLDREPVEWYTPEKLPDWLPIGPEELLVGAYVRQDGSVMLTVGNPTDTFVAARMDLRPAQGHMGGEVTITDPLAQVEVPLGRFMVLTIPANSFRVVVIARAE